MSNTLITKSELDYLNYINRHFLIIYNILLEEQCTKSNRQFKNYINCIISEIYESLEKRFKYRTIKCEDEIVYIHGVFGTSHGIFVDYKIHPFDPYTENSMYIEEIEL